MDIQILATQMATDLHELFQYPRDMYRWLRFDDFVPSAEASDTAGIYTLANGFLSGNEKMGRQGRDLSIEGQTGERLDLTLVEIPRDESAEKVRL